MKDLKTYDIAFSGLKKGAHHFEYEVEGDFFDFFGYEEIRECDLKVNVEFVKRETLMEVGIRFEGWVEARCDVTDEPFRLPLGGEDSLVVKFGDEFNFDDEHIVIIPRDEHRINIAQFIYEMIVLSIPAKKYHPDYLSGKIGAEQKRILDGGTSGTNENRNNEDTDQRWSKLKDLLTD